MLTIAWRRLRKKETNMWRGEINVQDSKAGYARGGLLGGRHAGMGGLEPGRRVEGRRMPAYKGQSNIMCSTVPMLQPQWGQGCCSLGSCCQRPVCSPPAVGLVAHCASACRWWHPRVGTQGCAAGQAWGSRQDCVSKQAHAELSSMPGAQHPRVPATARHNNPALQLPC